MVVISYCANILLDEMLECSLMNKELDNEYALLALIMNIKGNVNTVLVPY